MTERGGLSGRTAFVIGAGVIGTSWTALFLAPGIRAVVNDGRPDAVRVDLDDDLQRLVIERADAPYGGQPRTQLELARDRKQLAILHAPTPTEET